MLWLNRTNDRYLISTANAETASKLSLRTLGKQTGLHMMMPFRSFSLLL